MNQKQKPRRLNSTVNDARKTGLARALSKAGHCSRSQAAQLVRDGRVSINGHVRRDPEAPVRSGESIHVDGRELVSASKIYLMVNKPRGLVTTTSDEQGRQTIYDCLGDDLPWLAPVGRLDKASEGLLLLTNDSEWAARILSPDTHLPKTYHVQIDRLADEALLAGIQSGVQCGGDFLRADAVRLLRTGRRNSWVEIILTEGKNRHIRRMLEVFGVEVLRLVRVGIGSLQLGELTKGAYRPLTSAEKKALDVEMETRSRAG